jgi:hypothetical protein
MTDERTRPTGEGLPPVTQVGWDVHMTWDAVTVRGPYRATLSPKNFDELNHWRAVLMPYLSNYNKTCSTDTTLYLRFYGLDRLADVLQLGDPNDLARDLHEKTMHAVMLNRFSCAHNLMTFKSLVPSLPRSREQDLSMLHTQTPHGTAVKVKHDGAYHNAVLNSYSGMHARDVARFASRVPAVRWDKIDYVLDTCHLRPSMTVEERR